MIGLFLLLEIKKRAEKQTNAVLTQIVLGKTSAVFNGCGRRRVCALYRMNKAAEYAGFTKIEFVPEPLGSRIRLPKIDRLRKNNS
jgi:molecular chaperone DnaK (HSP70)